MRLLKGVLLGSAAGVAAVTAAPAADLPVKAKGVEYVRICSAYGNGFYYIPGTDICLRIGGYTWMDVYFAHRGAAALVAPGNLQTTGGVSHIFDRDVNITSWRTRTIMILDARTATALGTVRSYSMFGAQYTSAGTGGSPPGNVAPYLERAFIQIAGFTVGYTVSFFDAFSSFSVTTPNTLSYRFTTLIGYTASLGSGLSASVAFQDGQDHRSAITTLAYAPTAAAMGTNVYGGQVLPDLVGNVRVDQSWGSAQVSGALHEVRVNQAVANAGIGDTLGWAVGAAAMIKLPMLGTRDELRVQGVYSQGAIEYTGLSASSNTVQVSLG